jgi:nucleoid DNA-binding protein
MHDHIQYLLYRHNCVVLPGFGGIVLQYSPAKIHPAQHIFQPPRKALAFNRSLTTNDGLLISHLANAEQLHYDDAENKVRRFVEQIEDSIRRKGDYTLQGVGRFHNDIEGNLQFDPEESENYLLNAYGLDKFVSPAIVRRDAFEPNPAAQELKKKKRRFNWFGLSIVALVAMFIGVELASIQNFTSLLTKPLAGFNLFDTVKHEPAADVKHESVGSVGKRDTLVQIIVIKDERDEATADTAANLAVDPTPESTMTGTAATAVNRIVPAVEKPVANSLTYDDSVKLIEISKVPMRGEYNPSKTGRFVIVFSNSVDSAKADYYQRQLWKDRIGARVLPYRNRLIVAKQGYLTARAAAKDMAIYRLLGYDSAYVLKMKEEQP